MSVYIDLVSRTYDFISYVFHGNVNMWRNPNSINMPSVNPYPL